MRAFLAAYSSTGSKIKAARAANVDRSTPFTRSWIEYPGFEEACELAYRMAADRIEAAAWRRAIEGSVAIFV